MCGRWLRQRPGCWSAVDEDRLLTLADRHGVNPLLHTLFKDSTSADTAVPERLRTRWEEAYYGTRIRNAEALHVLARLLDRCRREHLDVRVLKGPSALAAVYGDIGLRPMADLDLLCRPADLARVARAAREAGFTGGDLYVHQVSLSLGEADGGTLDLHFRMHHGVTHEAAFLDDVWAHPTEASIEEWSFPVMTMEQQIVFDVAHCAHHAFDVSVRQLVDVAGRLLRGRDDVQAGHLTRLLALTGQMEAFLVLRGVAERWFGVALPHPTGLEVSPSLVAQYDARMQATAVTFGLEQRRVTASGLLGERGLVAKGRYAWERLLPPLAALQAAVNAPSRAAAAWALPGYALRNLAVVGRRWWQERR